MTERIPAPALRLIAARLARSIAQGALVVDFALYTKHLGWSAAFLGAILAAGMIFNASLTLLIGPLSDRIGRKKFVLSYEALTLLAAGIALATSAAGPLAFAAIIGGFGRGANGAAGPFSPAEQAWITGFLERTQLSTILSINTGAGFFGMAAGAVLAGVIGANRFLFILPVLAACIAALLLIITPDPRHRPEPPPASEAAARTEERGLLWQLAGLNLLNGAGIGMIGPFISWWFATKFHADAAQIGPALAAAFAMSGIAALTAGKLTQRLGTIRTVVLMRGAGLVLLLALPFAPGFLLAATLYTFRSAFNRGTTGARQAVALNLVRGHRRGLAASVNAFSIQVPRGVAPAIAGVLFSDDALTVPFLLAAAFQAAYLALYPRVFAKHDPSRKE